MLFGYNCTLVVIRRKLIIVKNFIFIFFHNLLKRDIWAYIIELHQRCINICLTYY